LVKTNISKREKILISIAAGVFLLAVLLFNTVGYLFDWRYVSVFAAVSEVNKFEVRSELLMEAMDQVGVSKPEQAAEVWANGLVARSAALQYAVMTKTLKDEYAARLEETFPNWVTGVSSPWVDSYKITRSEVTSEKSRVFGLTFSLKTSTGPAGTLNAILTVVREGDFWRITKITADEGLDVYTGF
jgi:hypothetical protein